MTEEKEVGLVATAEATWSMPEQTEESPEESPEGD